MRLLKCAWRLVVTKRGGPMKVASSSGYVGNLNGPLAAFQQRPLGRCPSAAITLHLCYKTADPSACARGLSVSHLLSRLRFEPHLSGSTSRELTATVAVNALNSRLLRFRFSKSPMKPNTGEPPQTLLLQYLMLVFIALPHHPRGQRFVSIAHIATWNMVVLMLLHEGFEQLEF